ncbi:sulfotransferase [Candidatus Cloacimonadota bacterium]
MANYNNILLVSVPRSGSTWIGSVIAHEKNSFMVYEPDNEEVNLRAAFYKRKYSRYPYLTGRDNSTEYYALFNRVFNKIVFPDKRNSMYLHKQKQKILRRLFKRRTLQIMSYDEGKKITKLVKSVHCGLALEFLIKNFQFKPVILLRHPANIALSFQKMNLSESEIDLSADNKLYNDYLKPYYLKIEQLRQPLEKIGFQIGFFYFYFAELKKKYKDIMIINHDEIINDPEKEFKKLFASLGLIWSNMVEHFVSSTNKPGEGHQIYRVLDNEKDKWKIHFSEDQLEQLRKGYYILPQTFYKEF